MLKSAEEKLPGISRLTNEKRVIFSHGKTKEVFLVSDELFKNYERIKPRHPYSMGLFMGEQTRTFNPSLSTAAEYVTKVSGNKIIVNKKAEQHFLYGNNLEKQMLLSISPNLKKSSIVVVCNERGEALGLGVLTVNPEEAQPGKLFVRNIKNISAYLRNKSI
jgi:ribosome biogenesis protein Nip4